ncbi:hypothetical protein [Deinococcus aerophilus]|uniref:Uncharacterized protein n=1 Tax=Deinococcus aerophilus TaxID=522488 RepID=A0ABQ2GUG4_9DEIO|nr:hypothetical protein [Deinococcus aerophilus]GGM11450.1 hypothetical protein GCM10010841_20010 [Deinococcus aerophilus]
MRLSLALLTACALAPWMGGFQAAASAPPASPLQPGQVWTLEALSADGEQFLTTLRLNGGAPQLHNGTATYPADRGTLLLDQEHTSLIALDLADARSGGLALACAYIGPLEGEVFDGVLAVTTLNALPSMLETALAVASVTRTPQERAEASAELRLGRCTLRRQTPTDSAGR